MTSLLEPISEKAISLLRQLPLRNGFAELRWT